MILGRVSASERMAPVQGLQPRERRRERTMVGCSPGAGDEGLLDGKEGVAAEIHGALAGEVEVDDRDVLFVDVLPDVHLGPVGKREDADAFAGVDARVVEVPKLGALVLGIPLAGTIAEGVDAFLGAGFFFVAAGAAEGRGEAVVARASSSAVVFSRPQQRLVSRAMGLVPAAMAGSLRQTRSSAPRARAIWSRKASISANLKPVSMWRSGNGMGPGKKAFCARRSMTEESLPME